ncbi:hypothetical protein ACFRQM_40105 [Streptomyces sp. NPDC056831]|uniref:hypothetical protein n=1 Tax=Streptomyces sp. NPDC056831 TaxID=3345954 RepID=UPI0036C2BA92
MTNPYTYGTQQWREAFEAAEGAEWDEIDASEHGGELARVVAELYTADLVGKDEGRLYAAVTVAATRPTSSTRSSWRRCSTPTGESPRTT